MYKELPTTVYIFKPIHYVLQLLSNNEDWEEINWTEDCNVSSLKGSVNDLLNLLDNLKVKMEPILPAPEIPKRLKLYECEVDDK